MGTNRTSRIKERRPILDAQAVNRVCVVAAPDLRCVIQHARIKPAAATAASLDQHIWIAMHQSLEELVYTAHIVICHFPLRVFYRVDIGEAAVHIPLHILDISLIKHRTDLVKNMITHFFSRKIKH